jgi:Concanavalin A-like lectin/glucanases superfamily
MAFAVVTASMLAAGPVVASGASAAPAPGFRRVAWHTVARYSFDSVTSTGVVADDSGRGGALRVVSRAGGGLRVISGVPGRAVLFPPRCGGNCPRAILQSHDDDALDPGTRPIRYGADVLLRSEQTSDGANIVQKGTWSSGSQWKLQVDGHAGRPSCALAGTGSKRVHLATAPQSIADGRWHQVTCERSGTVLRIIVDGATREQISVPAGLTVHNATPLRVAGNTAGAGSDRFVHSGQSVRVQASRVPLSPATRSDTLSLHSPLRTSEPRLTV